MNNEKKIWLCEQYAHKAWTLSLALAQEAARANQFGKGYAVVAEETRTLANKLFEYCAAARFDSGDESIFKGIMDFAVEMSFLSINTMIEILRVNYVISDKAINKSMAVLTEDLRRLAIDVHALAKGNTERKPYVFPEVLSPIKSSGKTEFFFRFSIGGISLVENPQHILEIGYTRREDLEGGSFSLRGTARPIIDCYKHFGFTREYCDKDRQAVIIISPYSEFSYHGNTPEKIYAVPIDDLDEYAVFSSRIGYSVPSAAGNVLADYTRECWDAVGGGQLMFVDWKKLIEQH